MLFFRSPKPRPQKCPCTRIEGPWVTCCFVEVESEASSPIDGQALNLRPFVTGNCDPVNGLDATIPDSVSLARRMKRRLGKQLWKFQLLLKGLFLGGERHGEEGRSGDACVSWPHSKARTFSWRCFPWPLSSSSLLPMLCLFLPLLFLLTSFLCSTLVLIELEENLPLG